MTEAAGMTKTAGTIGTTEQDVSISPSPPEAPKDPLDMTETTETRFRATTPPEGQKPIYQSLSYYLQSPTSFLLSPFSSVPVYPTNQPSY